MSKPCCRAFTAECLACAENISIFQFCSRDENKNIIGCEKYYYAKLIIITILIIILFNLFNK